MSAEVLKKAFEPFFTTKPVGSGTGLGLSQVYGIAKQTGGTVTIDTKVSQGTTVSVYLPSATALPVERATDNAPNVPLGEHKGTILIVDDDKDVRQLAVSCPETLGYQVLAAGSWHAAIDMVASDARIDLILIDIAMPEITGVEVMEVILKKRPHIPSLYMTGYVGPTKLNLSEQRILKKPFTIAELAAKVEELLFPNNSVSNGKVIPLVRPASWTALAICNYGWWQLSIGARFRASTWNLPLVMTSRYWPIVALQLGELFALWVLNTRLVIPIFLLTKNAR